MPDSSPAPVPTLRERIIDSIQRAQTIDEERRNSLAEEVRASPDLPERLRTALRILFEEEVAHRASILQDIDGDAASIREAQQDAGVRTPEEQHERMQIVSGAQHEVQAIADDFQRTATGLLEGMQRGADDAEIADLRASLKENSPRGSQEDA